MVVLWHMAGLRVREPAKTMGVDAGRALQAETDSGSGTIAKAEDSESAIPQLADIQAAVATNDFSILTSDQPGSVLARVDGHPIQSTTFELAARQWPASSERA